jgi:16S rRNA (uracil1498-N3)-methyltransferase
MKRFIVRSAPDRNGTVRLAGDDYHYLVRVRRLAPGEFFSVLLPDGAEALVRVRSVEGGVLAGDVQPAGAGAGGIQPLLKSTLPPVVLLQALPKGEKMDLIVRQAAEGGVSAIVPFTSEFSIPKTGGEAGAKRIPRWERIIKAARQQSGSAVATTVTPPLSMDGLFVWWDAFIKERPKALGLLLHHQPLAEASLHGYLDSNPETVALAVGPEGGFSPAEAGRFIKAGFCPLTIGDTVLRTETAALYGAAAIRIILLERNSWEMKPRPSVNG